MQKNKVLRDDEDSYSLAGYPGAEFDSNMNLNSVTEL